MRHWNGRSVAILLSMAMVVACGGSDEADGDANSGAGSDVAQESVDDDLQEAADAFNDAMGAGGGGTLVFDGVEFPIASVICADAGGRIDIGTVDEQGNRVLVSGEADDLSVQILTPDGATMTQWFDTDPVHREGTPVQITRSANTWETPTASFWNNQDDRVIDGSFRIECP